MEQSKEELLNKIEELKRVLKIGISMRVCQKAYFKKRSTEMLKESKELERAFDKDSIAAIKGKQTNLFE